MCIRVTLATLRSESQHGMAITVEWYGLLMPSSLQLISRLYLPSDSCNASILQSDDWIQSAEHEGVLPGA